MQCVKISKNFIKTRCHKKFIQSGWHDEIASVTNIEPNDASCNLDNCFILSTWKCIYQMHVMQYFCPLHQSVLHDKIHFIFWSKQFHHQSMCVCDKVTQLKLQARSTLSTNHHHYPHTFIGHVCQCIKPILPSILWNHDFKSQMKL